MNTGARRDRVRFTTVAFGWVVLITGALVALPLPFRARLPAELATHWGAGGRPDGSMFLPGLEVTQVLVWWLLAAVGMGFLLRGGVLRRRNRAWAGALLAGGAALVLGLAAFTVWANLDLIRWQDAPGIGWRVFAVLAVAVAAGAAGAWLVRKGPDEPPDPVDPVRMPLQAGKRFVWVSSASNAALVAMGVALLLVAALLAVLADSASLTAAVGLAVTGLVVLAFSSVRVQIGDRGVVIAFGPLRWPVRHLPLQQLELAYTREQRPLEVGGWGYRMRHGRSTIMVRGGECLILRRSGKADLGISVRDAERGAALLNGLLGHGTAHDDSRNSSKDVH